MGIQDRDWYIAELRKRLSYQERAKYRKAANGNDNRDAPIRITQPTTKRGAHWVVMLLFWTTIFTIVLTIARQLR
ncbi:hypothetical protein [Ralstonia pickettii]|jgi:hypothetical protein|uniref:hypothetical protein n=1 Tax=Ralstonia pickettii TaxID=329 RepID=UPI0015FCBC0E|nr:hypothetical protein [Ralstonia pickettii]MBB0022781.1 hypothetical protein [Ralstonia pickettii]MBB0033338.1 hypothetical protein [Ralstonia pickettii]MBB0096133.1 hypothetical protein [Ralstonia pickettii]MBB0105806.1 hypothetical protein [Ralstonia pickettii]MBB0127450.1 hypothetical protein [Ralstonia pickettii]